MLKTKTQMIKSLSITDRLFVSTNLQHSYYFFNSFFKSSQIEETMYLTDNHPAETNRVKAMIPIAANNLRGATGAVLV